MGLDFFQYQVFVDLIPNEDDPCYIPVEEHFVLALSGEEAREKVNQIMKEKFQRDSSYNPFQSYYVWEVLDIDTVSK